MGEGRGSVECRYTESPGSHRRWRIEVADTFVTDRAFEEFCKKHGDEISIALIDPATAKWLIRSTEFHRPSPIPAAFRVL